jgi:release factor glutamine methyltransferase
MTLNLSPERLAAVADRLRAAGCVFAEDEARLITEAAATPDDLDALVGRRAAGEPLEWVVGWAEFRGLRVAVEPGVFVPRRRTELLADEAVALADGAMGRAVVVDLCCGSGAIGAAVAAAVPDIELHAADIDPVAVRCARRNIGAAGRVHEGDLYSALPGDLRGRVAVLAVNVPYVPTGDIALLPAEARDHEPRRTLDGGADGLDVLRRVAADAPRWLAPAGALLTEASDRQVPLAHEVLAAAGLVPRVVIDEDRGATVLTGTHAG